MEYVTKILSLSEAISWMAEDVKANKKCCRRLAQRVKVLKDLVLCITQRSQISPNVNRALLDLCIALNSAQELIRKCTKAKFPLKLMKYKSEFSSVSEALTNAFQVLSGALQVKPGNTMHEMFEDAYRVEDDYEDWEDELPFYGAMAPVSYASATPHMTQPHSAVYAAVMHVEDGSLFFAEGVFLQ